MTHHNVLVKTKAGKSVIQFFQNHGRFILSILSALGLAAVSIDFDIKQEWGVFLPSAKGIAWVGALVLFAFAGVLEHRKSLQLDAENEDLRQRNKQLEQKAQGLVADLDATREYLIGDTRKTLEEIADSLNLRASERVSLYRLSGDGSSFETVARYSEHPTHNLFGRAKIPLDQGVVGEVWNNSEHNGCYMCDPLPNPEYRFEDYRRELRRLNFSDDEIRSIRMKSRQIYARVFRNPISENGQHRKVGIVVIESLKSDRLDIDEINSTLDNETHRYLRTIRLHVEKTQKISLDFARSRGL